MAVERRAPFVADEAKFATQRLVTYALLLIFAAVTINIMRGSDQAERSMILQTVINFTMLAIGFWLGSSKGAADNRDQLNRMIPPTPSAPGAVTPGPETPAGVIPAAEVVKP